MNNEADRTKLEAVLGVRLEDWVWEVLWSVASRDRLSVAKRLIENAPNAVRYKKHPPRKKHVVPNKASARGVAGRNHAKADALAKLLAKKAVSGPVEVKGHIGEHGLCRVNPEEKDISVFRASVLNGELLPIDGVSNWIMGEAVATEPTVYVTLPLPQGVQLHLVDGDVCTSGSIDLPRGTASSNSFCRYLYCKVEDRSVLSVPTNAHGNLEKLRKLSVLLSLCYGWDEEDAALFVLTGIEPPVPRVKAFTTPAPWGEPKQQKLILEVDPSIGVMEIGGWYKSSKKMLRFKAERNRSCGLKAFKLASFYGEHAQWCNPNWRELFSKWNELHRKNKKYVYKQLKFFKRDCKNALGSLITVKDI
jgi:hypothetical protein